MSTGNNGAIQFTDVKPWPDPVEGPQLLGEIADWLESYLYLPRGCSRRFDRLDCNYLVHRRGLLRSYPDRAQSDQEIWQEQSLRPGWKTGSARPLYLRNRSDPSGSLPTQR